MFALYRPKMRKLQVHWGSRAWVDTHSRRDLKIESTFTNKGGAICISSNL